MRSLSVLLMLVLAGLAAPTATAQAPDAPDADTFTCDLPTIPEGTGPVVDAYEAADGFACSWVNFLVDGVPCVVAALPDDPVAVLLCYYPTLPVEAGARASALPDEEGCYLIILQTSNIFAPGPLRDNYVFLGAQACAAYGIAHGLTGLPLLDTVREKVGDVVDSVGQSVECTGETQINEAPSAVRCWVSVQPTAAAGAPNLHDTWEYVWCTITVYWASPEMQENWDFLVAFVCAAGHLVIDITGAPVVDEVVRIVSETATYVEEGVQCTGETKINEAPSAVRCWVGIEA